MTTPIGNKSFLSGWDAIPKVDAALTLVRDFSARYIAPPVMQYLSKGDDKIVENLTGSKEIFSWIEFLSDFLPDWVPSDVREKLFLHFIAVAAKEMDLKEPISSGELLTKAFTFYQKEFTDAFSQVEAECSKKHIFPEESNFEAVSQKMVQKLFPYVGAAFSGYLTRFLYELYTALYAVPEESQPSHYREELSEMLQKGVREVLVKTLNSKELVESFSPPEAEDASKAAISSFLASNTNSLLEFNKAFSRFVLRKAEAFMEKNPSGTLSGAFHLLAGAIKDPAKPDYKAFVELLLGDVEAESTIPIGLRSGIKKYLEKQAWTPFRKSLKPFFALAIAEGKERDDTRFEGWGIRKDLDKRIDELVESYHDSISFPYKELIPESLFKAVLRLLILHAMQNFARGMKEEPESVKAFMEEIGQFVINKLSTSLQQIKNDSTLDYKPLKEDLKGVLNRFFPGLLVFELSFLDTFAKELYRLSQVKADWDSTKIEALCPGYEAEAKGFMDLLETLFDQVVSSQVEKAEKLEGLHLEGVKTLFQQVEKGVKLHLLIWIKSLLNSADPKGQNPLYAVLSQKMERLAAAAPKGSAALTEELFRELHPHMPFRDLLVDGVGTLVKEREEVLTGLLKDMPLMRAIPQERFNDPAFKALLSHTLSLMPKEIAENPSVEPLVRQAFGHLMRQAGAENVNEWVTRLFIEGAAGFKEEGVEGALGRLLATAHPGLVPLAPDLAKRLVSYMDALKLKNLDPVKNSIQDKLTGVEIDSGEMIRSLEAQGRLGSRIQKIQELSPHYRHLVALISKTSEWIVEQGLETVQKPDSKAPYLSQLADRPEIFPLKQFAVQKINEILLVAVRHVIASYKEKGVANGDMLKAVLDDLIKLINDKAPDKKSAHDPNAWAPFVKALLSKAYPEPLEFLEKPLQRECVKWHKAFYRYIDQTDESKKSLKEHLKTNKVSLFSSVLGRQWVPEFIPYILRDQKETIAESLQELVKEKLDIDLSKSAIELVISTLENFALDHRSIADSGPLSPVDLFSEWLGEYSEAFLLKLFSSLVGQLKFMDKELEKEGKNIPIAYVEKIAKEVDRYYNVVQALKQKAKGRKSRNIDPADLIAELEKAGLKNDALPLIEDDTPAKVKKRQRDHFNQLFSGLLNSLEMGEEKGPYPAPVSPLLYEMMTNLVLANTLLVIKKSLMENRGKFILNGFETLRKAIRKMEADRLANSVVEPCGIDMEDEDEVEPGVKYEVSPEVKKSLGATIAKLLATLPNLPWAPILEIDKIKEMNGAPAVDLLAEEDIYQRLEGVLETVLPNLVPGRIRKRANGEYEFVRRDPATAPINFDPDPTDHEALIRQLQNVGADAFITGFEMALKNNHDKLVNSVEGFFEFCFDHVKHFFLGDDPSVSDHNKMERVLKGILDAFELVATNVYQYLKKVLELFIVCVCYLPYHLLIRFPLREYFKRIVVMRIYTELTEKYNEGVYLNSIDRLMELITREKHAKENV